MGEEATEVVIAAKNEDPQELIYETADVFYHFARVISREKGVSYEAILEELASREGVVASSSRDYKAKHCLGTQSDYRFVERSRV